MAVILFPTKFEAESFVKRLINCAGYDMADNTAWVGEIGRTTVHVAIIGMGMPHCQSRTKIVLELTKPKRVILAGFGGALDPALKQGEIITDSDGSTVHTVDAVVGTADDKARLFAETNKPIIDMESDPVRSVAEAMNIPLTVVRAVSDTATDEIPAFLAKGYDQEKGKETPWQMAKHLITHPQDFGKLKRIIDSWEPVRVQLADALVKEIEGSKK